MGEILPFGDAQLLLPLLCLEHLLAFLFFALLKILALLAALAPGIGLAANVILYRWVLREVVYQSHDCILHFDIFLDLYLPWVRLPRLGDFSEKVRAYKRYEFWSKFRQWQSIAPIAVKTF